MANLLADPVIQTSIGVCVGVTVIAVAQIAYSTHGFRKFFRKPGQKANQEEADRPAEDMLKPNR